MAYALVEYVHMWEMALWVFIRMPHAVDVTSVSRAALPTGFSVAKNITGVQFGNKGAVGIGFRWRETTLAFVMAHLPARPDLARLRKREADYRRIVNDLSLETPTVGTVALAAGAQPPPPPPGSALPSGIDWVHGHDHVWFFGDTNYRVDLPFERCGGVRTP